MGLSGHLDTQIGSDRVEFVFTVENEGDESTILRFNDGQEADVVVRAAGQEVFRWSADRMFMQVIHQVELGPGETEIYEMEWENPASGEFTAEAILTAENQDVSATAVVSIP